MHHMEIQHGKEGTKSSKFNDTMGATTCCTLGLLLNTILPEQQGSKHRIQGDAWFGNVNTANGVGISGYNGFLG